MARLLTRLRSEIDGSVIVESAVMLTILFVFILGSVDFLFAFYEWNAATKAVQVGARIAAVSDPVAKGLDKLSTALVSRTFRPGSVMPAFTVTCDGATAKCDCAGSCVGGVVTFSQAALDTIVFGRGRKACGDATTFYAAGMCNILGRISSANVRVVYRQAAGPAGLGYVGRPGGPVPTITVSLQNLTFQFFFLRFHNLGMPSSATTVTAEDLSSCAPDVDSCGVLPP